MKELNKQIFEVVKKLYGRAWQIPVQFSEQVNIKVGLVIFHSHLLDIQTVLWQDPPSQKDLPQKQTKYYMYINYYMLFETKWFTNKSVLNMFLKSFSVLN